MKLINNLQGQSLIEITVALGALVVILTVSSTAIISALNNSQEAKYQNQASVYAQQGIEVLRQTRDSSWTTFDNLSGAYCMASSCTQLKSNGPCGPKNGTCGKNVDIFSRSVTLVKNNSQCNQDGVSGTKAFVTVAWSDSKCSPQSAHCRKVELETCFSNLYHNSGL